MGSVVTGTRLSKFELHLDSRARFAARYRSEQESTLLKQTGFLISHWDSQSHSVVS